MPPAQAKKVLDPIVARIEQAGYGTTVTTGAFLGWAGKGAPHFNGNMTVYKNGRLARELGPQGNSGKGEYAVIGTRAWAALSANNPRVSNTQKRFRQVVEAAEGCGSNCKFSASSFR